MSKEQKGIEMKTMSQDHPDTKCGWPIEKYEKWMADVNKRIEKKPFEERRIGWITKLPNYKVMCCGQSTGDFFLILFLMLLFYVLNGGFFMLVYYVTGMGLVISSYVYGVLGIVFMLSLLVAIIVKGKTVENDYLEELADEMN